MTMAFIGIDPLGSLIKNKDQTEFTRYDSAGRIKTGLTRFPVSKILNRVNPEKSC
jgi:hypothetical protein